ncbi:MAG: CoA transferase [Pseudomonadota bacterium]
MGEGQGARPLAGLRVIDFGQYIAGPAVAMMLADQGAEVIRVDPPGGPFWDSPTNAVLNRGKKSIALDLKQDADRATARRLVASADVVVENFRPGVMARLGLDISELRARNPRLVGLSLPGFAAADKERAGLQAWEGVIAASVGQFTDMGLNRILMGINPSFSPLTLASAYGAVLGAMAVTFALHRRQIDGRGEAIEVPLAAALLEGLAYNSMTVEDLPERYKSLREREIERRRAAGQAMDMSYEDLQEILDPFYRSYRCADGRLFYAVCSSHNMHPVNALKLLGLWEELEAAGIPLDDPYLPMAQWANGADCTLLAYPLTKGWADRVSSAMKEAFAARGAFEWETLFGQAGVPAAAHRTTKEWVNSEHALASGLCLEVDDPVHGLMRQAGNVSWLKSDEAAVVQKKPAPRLDADRTEILASLPELPEPSAGAAEGPREGWLAGLKVLDLTNVIAGPTIAATLARFGAEVISVDPPMPALDPWNTIVFGMQANRGKRSLLLDLKSEEGQAVLERLLADVDVVTANALDKQLAPLGIDEETLRRINPNVILCQLDAYGGPRRGPRSDYPGYDDLVQASTGIMARFGGSIETPEEHAHFGTIDVLGGFCAALAIGVALIKRGRGGGPDVARASLAAAGQLIQIPFLYDYDGRPPFDEPSGRQIKGAHGLYRCYQAADGWFFLALEPERLGDLGAIAEIDNLPEADVEAALAARFRTRPRAWWIERLREADMGAQPTDTMADVRTGHLVADDGPESAVWNATMAFIAHTQHPSGRRVELVAPNAIRATEGAVRVPFPAPRYGAHSREVLAQLGFGEAEIDRMIAAGVAAERWSDDYLPD